MGTVRIFSERFRTAKRRIDRLFSKANRALQAANAEAVPDAFSLILFLAPFSERGLERRPK
jgi:hypothetical protein